MTNQPTRRPGIVRRLYRAALCGVRNRLLLTSFLFGVVPIKLVTDHLTRWIHNPDTRDDITLVLARKRPAPE